MSDRIWKIKIEPYDQVLALTQHMINQGIDNLYVRLATGEIVDGATKPKPGIFFADENNWVKGVQFGPPAVIVKADYGNVRSVRFRINLKSGNIQLRRFIKMDDETGEIIAEKLNMEIQNWHMTVPVDVGFIDVGIDTPRGKAIAERSAAKGKPDYSIYELLMNLESMSVGDATWEIGKWGDDDWVVGQDGNRTRPAGWQLGSSRQFNDLSKDYQKTMEYCSMKISGNLTRSNLTSMGFAIMAPNASRPATFEVNNVRYMTYPWTDPDSHTAATPGLDGDGRLNYLLYLETFRGNTPPLESSKDAVLGTRMGNWTDGRKPGIDDQSKFGTFILSSANFMEKYLVPKLSSINRIMSMDISNVSTWAEYNFFSYKWSVGADFSIGLGNADEDKTTFKLKKQDYTWNDSWQQEAKDFLKRFNEPLGSGSNVWKYQDIEWGSSAKHSYTHVGPVEVWMSGDTITFTRLYTSAGSNEIVYEGGQWTKFEYKIDPSTVDFNVYEKIIAQTNWKIKFQLQEVTDGGMQIGVNYETPSTTFSGDHSSNSLTFIKTKLEPMYKSAGDNFEWYVNSIRNCLQGQEKFTLPASGVYFFKNPLMNAKGDLICGLEYNGNPQLGDKINETTKTQRLEIPQGDITSMPDKAVFKTGKEQKRD